jgi:hypothetical protein
MAIVAHVVLSGLTKGDYDRVREAAGWLQEAPAGGISHLTWWDGTDCHNVDAWESEEAFNEFGQLRLGPAMAKVGVENELQVTFYQAHEVYVPQAVTITA